MSKFFDQYHGPSFKKDGKCYCYVGPSYDTPPDMTGTHLETILGLSCGEGPTGNQTLGIFIK